MIDSIDPRTFRPNTGGIGCSLGFLWQLTEHSIDIQPKDQERRTSPIDYIRSPAMAGGLFTFNREYFWKLGGYDEDLSFWGTENLEISFWMWQCGGTLECSPCSRVYHAFRGHHPYSLPPNSITKNKLRTAAIWMDEYAFITQKSLGSQKIDIGPLDKTMALRKRLECKPFSRYTKKGLLLHAKTAKCLAVSDQVGGRNILKMASCSDSSVKLEWKMELRHKRPQLARNPLKNEKKPPAAII